MERRLQSPARPYPSKGAHNGAIAPLDEAARSPAPPDLRGFPPIKPLRSSFFSNISTVAECAFLSLLLIFAAIARHQAPDDPRLLSSFRDG
jgi:hypothetical protein